MSKHWNERNVFYDGGSNHGTVQKVCQPDEETEGLSGSNDASRHEFWACENGGLWLFPCYLRSSSVKTLDHRSCEEIAMNRLIRVTCAIVGEDLGQERANRIAARAQERYKKLCADNASDSKALRSHIRSRRAKRNITLISTARK